MNYPWQGNIRELKHTIEHACVLCPGCEIFLKHLPAEMSVEKAPNITYAGISEKYDIRRNVK